MTAQFIMPSIAAFALAMAMATSATAWLAHADRNSSRVSLWDYAGASMLIAIAAGMFSHPIHVTQFFGVAIAP